MNGAALEDRILDALDISTNIERCLAGVRQQNVRGWSAFFMTCVLLYINIWLWKAIWYWDLDSTAVTLNAWVKSATGLLNATGTDPVAFGYVLSYATYLPTAFEMTGALWARVRFEFARWFLYVLFVFDAVTDWPRVQSSFTAAWPTGAEGDSWVYLYQAIWYVLRAAWLVMATTGFEHMFAVFAVVNIVLFFRIFARDNVRSGMRRSQVIDA